MENAACKKQDLTPQGASAGKTKATELIIRSAFLSGRSSLAVIVAPFRALCHEIRDSLESHFHGEAVKVNEMSDVIQKDFEIHEFLGHKQVIVVTPEKLNYILRYEPALTDNIKLVIYDEGHLFDDTSRGVTYELLLSSLRVQLPVSTQTVLISAVIKNADDINQWLLRGDGNIVSGISLTPTYRTVAFTIWKDALGRLEFVRPEAPTVKDFFVPRVIAQENLELIGRERRLRKFPEKGDYKEIALYLGLKLVINGSVAIFTGRKDTAARLCDTIVEKYSRNLLMAPPSEFSDSVEIEKLVFLHRQNFGDDKSLTKAAALGIFLHHGNTPQGIRLAIEYALQRGLVRFVICTSTLAQGVNLPLRYLIVSSARQGKERIKTRDFHNLMGRAGRSGMSTEGSIIFADPLIYDQKNSSTENWRWSQAVELLNPDYSEPCNSFILSLFDPLRSDDERYSINISPLELINLYIMDTEKLYNLPA